MSASDILSEVEKEIERSQSRRLDKYLYNGGVALTLLFTGTATIIGAINGTSEKPLVPIWFAPLLSGLATIWVGIDSRLEFGRRWLYHRMMGAAYLSLKRRLTSLEVLPPEKREAELYAIREEFVALPKLNLEIPGLPSSRQTEEKSREQNSTKESK